MNGCHHDARHQGQQQTLSLLNDQFWWPGMATQMQRAISSCEQCIQHEGIHAKAPMWLIIVTTPLELLHVDFTSIETMMELDQPQKWWTFWSFVTILWSMSWCTWPPIKLQKLLLSSCGKATSQSLEHQPSSWVTEGPIWKQHHQRALWAYGIQKVRTSPYHAQTNGQVEWAHQTLMCMIGKLSKDQKADWPKHLPKLVHAYNSMRLAITRYSPHYLMFGAAHTYPLTSISPWSGVHRNTNMLTTTLPSCMKDCGRPLKRLKCSPHQRQRDRSGTMIGKLMPFHWSQVTWSWLKPMPTGGGERWRISGRRNHVQSGAPNCGGHPFLPCEKPVDQMLMSPPPKLTFSHCSDRGVSSLYGCAGQVGQVHHPP